MPMIERMTAGTQRHVWAYEGSFLFMTSRTKIILKREQNEKKTKIDGIGLVKTDSFFC